MKTSLPIALLMLLSSGLITSCKSPRYMYTAPAQNIPLLKEKGDSKAAAYYSSSPGFNTRDLVFPESGSYSRGLDVQGAYAFTDHFAAILSYSRRWERNGSIGDIYEDSSVLHYKRNLTEIGGGYYTALDQQEMYFFQAFAGVGFGQSTIRDEHISTGALKNHSVNVTRYFVQPVLSHYGQGNFAFSFGSRFSFLKFSKIQTDYNNNEKIAYQLDSLDTGLRTFWEPTLNYSFGFDRFPGVRLEFQTGFSALLSKRYIDTRNFNVSVGVNFDFGKMTGRNEPASRRRTSKSTY